MTEGLLKAAGDPLKNIRVLIVDNSNQLVKMLNTNDSGKFTAGNLPVGTYKIKTDLVNVSNTTPKTVTLDSANLTAAVKLTVNKTGTSNTGLNKLPALAGATTLLFPNPSNGTLNIHTAASDFHYAIYTITGQLLQSASLTGNHAVIDLQAVHPGVYFVRIGQNGKTETRKLVLSY
jgi:hypothetical protein